MKPHNFICNNTENSLKYFIRAIFTWGPWSWHCMLANLFHNQWHCWTCLLVLCLCVYVQVHLCVCWGRGCMFAMFVCLSYWATIWSNSQVKNWSLIHQVLYMQKEQQNMIQTFKWDGGIYFKCLSHLVTPICTTIGSGAGQ